MVNIGKHKKRPTTILFKVRQSSPFLWFLLLISIFIVGFIYVILSEPLGYMYNLVYDSPELMEDDYQTFFTRSKTIWFGALLAYIIGIMIYILIKMSETSDPYGRM